MYTLKAITDFRDKYDETKKYKTNEEIVVDEERALELLSSETPVVKYVSRDIDTSEKDNLIDDKKLLETTVNTLKEEIEILKNEIKELKSKKKSEDKEQKTE